MLKPGFGIVDEVDRWKNYAVYEPEKYGCVYIDNGYIDDWWEKLGTMKTYLHRMNRPGYALSRWGVTLIPPGSLPIFLEIVSADSRIETDSHLTDLTGKIEEAIEAKKFMIHFGV